VHEVLGDHEAEIAADRAGRRRGGISGSHHRPPDVDRTFTLQPHDHDGARGDEVDELPEERLALVLGVVLAGEGLRDPDQPRAAEVVPLALETADDLAGEIDAGIAYHYYWYRDREESGSDSDSSALHFFGDQDPGAFLSVSGAGILKSSEHAEAAEEFVDWLTSTAAQQAMAESYALEYPLNPDASV